MGKARDRIKDSQSFLPRVLQRNCIVKRGIAGLDPDGEEGPQLQRWLDEHPERKALSDEQKTILRQRAKDVHFWDKGEPFPSGPSIDSWTMGLCSQSRSGAAVGWPWKKSECLRRGWRKKRFF
jgi:hypothetical protein